jgi:teichuronic acid biosynthesis glycosyltransferase TuaC
VAEFAAVRALIVTNMYPSPSHPALGSFVRDQVEALRRIPELQVELFAFDPGGAGAYLQAARALKQSKERYDVVHAHFGLTAWPALAASGARHAVTLHGTDLAHPRSRAITLAALRLTDLVAAVSEPLAAQIPGWATRQRPPAVLPCGVDTRRFHQIARAQAREALGLPADKPCLLFPANPARAEKRFDRAQAVAQEIPLLTLRDVDPQRVPLWVNAANAVLVPSEREGFGLAVLEALACEVPVLATPVGIAPEVLADLPGAYCAPFEQDAWRAAMRPHVADPDPRIGGRERAERYSADRMAANVLAAWSELVRSP